jgi:CheY-like chemotaxis protein
MTILLVDDDEDDRKLFIDATREVDSAITCFSASDGIEAMAYLRDDHNDVPDFIFLDLRMPGFSGEECLMEIKREPRMANVPAKTVGRGAFCEQAGLAGRSLFYGIFRDRRTLVATSRNIKITL